jgi:hypothetical protein
VPVAVIAILCGLLATAGVIMALRRIGDHLRTGFTAIESLAASSAAQVAEMRRMGEVSAQSVRISSGAYVFELRDRFDNALGLVQVGVAETRWTAVHVDGTESDERVDVVVLEEGERARVRMRFVLSQAPGRRLVNARWTDVPSGLSAAPAHLHSPAGIPSERGYELPSDLSLFVDTTVDIDPLALGNGGFDLRASFGIDVTDTRPEGAVAKVPVSIRFRGIVVDDDGGKGFDVPTVDAEIGIEDRVYFLVKEENLPLDLPRVPPSL